MNKSSNQDYDHLFKILVVGNSSTGKTSFISRFVNDTFTDLYTPSRDFEFKIKLINIENSKVKLQIWDIYFDRFRAQRIPYRGSHAIFIVFDICDEQSFKDVKNWYMEIERYAPEDIIVGIVGSNLDSDEINHTRRVSIDTILEFTERMDLKYYEVSSKYNINIERAFVELSLKIYQQKVLDHISTQPCPKIKITKPNSKKNKCIIN